MRSPHAATPSFACWHWHTWYGRGEPGAISPFLVSCPISFARFGSPHIGRFRQLQAHCLWFSATVVSDNKNSGVPQLLHGAAVPKLDLFVVDAIMMFSIAFWFSPLSCSWFDCCSIVCRFPWSSHRLFVCWLFLCSFMVVWLLFDGCLIVVLLLFDRCCCWLVDVLWRKKWHQEI